MTMRYASIKAAILIVAGTLALCIYFATCNCDGPLEPVPQKDYVVYFTDAENVGQFFGYHVLTGKLDSFYIPIKPECGMTVSADGKKLYIALRDSSFVVDLEDHENVTRLPYGAQGGIAVSSDNQLLAILGAESINILSTSDYNSVVLHDTDYAYYGTFSADSRSFYCRGGASGASYVYKAVLDGSSPVIRKRFSDWGIGEVVPSIDESTWFVYTGWDLCHMALQVFDVASDSVVFYYYFEPGNGELELTPDGKHLFFTYPDYRITYCFPAKSSFTIYDVNESQISNVIVSIDSLDPAIPDFYEISEIEITPDGRWLVGMDSNLPALIVVNITTMQLKRHIVLSGPRDLYGLTCQNAP